MAKIGPNFLVIGAARCGTTALTAHLAQHPQAFLSQPKEPHFLAFAGKRPQFRGPGDELMINRIVVTDFERYKQLFQKGKRKVAVGEGSVSTLYYAEQAVKNIRQFVPDVKLVAILRNPIDRAYSSFLYTTSLGYENVLEFNAALDSEPGRIADNWHHLWHYTGMGFYSLQLPCFLKEFGRARLKIFLMDDLLSSPKKVAADLAEFLDLNPALSPPRFIDANRSGIYRNRIWAPVVFAFNNWPILKRMAMSVFPTEFLETLRNSALRRPSMSRSVRARLRDVYRDEIGWLEDVVGRSLQHWLEDSPENYGKAI